MSGEIILSDLDLAALLCSRVCHDVISPVGAITNGLELLEVEDDESMREMAMDLVKKSAKQASAKLQFCRIAFGAAGSAGSLIDMGEAGDVARAFVGEEKVKLEWQAPRENRPKTEVKLVLNMMLLGIAGIPRGGKVRSGLRAADSSCARKAIRRAFRRRSPKSSRGGAEQPGTRCALGTALLFEAACGERRTSIVDGAR